MKTLKALAVALVLALSLSIPAYADDTDPGDSHSPGHTEPTVSDTETTLPNSNTNGGKPAVDTDPGFPTVADILWALASIY